MKGNQITGGSVFNDTWRPFADARAARFMNPDEVVGDRALTLTEKRAVLASWASDVLAVPDAPTLRHLDNGAVVRVDDILRALRSLDASEEATPYPVRPLKGLRIFHTRRGTAVRRRSWSDDDDDPPPCPAMIARPPGGPLSGGEVIDASLLLAA